MDFPAEWMQFQLPSAMVEPEVFAAAKNTEIIFTKTNGYNLDNSV